jgi:hypothetical protein
MSGGAKQTFHTFTPAARRRAPTLRYGSDFDIKRPAPALAPIAGRLARLMLTGGRSLTTEERRAALDALVAARAQAG